MGYTFLDLAEETLQKAMEPLTVEEIWKKAGEYGLQSKCSSSGKTPWRTIGAQIYVNIRDNENSIFCKVLSRPTRFGLTKITYSNKSATENPADTEKFEERALHPLLSKYVYGDSNFKCYTKTIYHEKSRKNTKGKDKWLHPDIVGIYFPHKDYHILTTRAISGLRETALKLFSFEMKITVSITSLREYYFQAVSNSSWANEGYLVALNYENSTELIDEMRRLNNAFGIGFIKLNAENIEQSEILFSAKPNKSIDWETVNRLAEENPDFRDFLSEMTTDIDKEIIRGIYDKILNDDEYHKYIKAKKIVK